jgi:hypothetical protein
MTSPKRHNNEFSNTREIEEAFAGAPVIEVYRLSGQVVTQRAGHVRASECGVTFGAKIWLTNQSSNRGWSTSVFTVCGFIF